MSETPHPLFQLLSDDRRYKFEAYQFVREALAYAQDELEMGKKAPDSEVQEPHLTGQQLCEAIRIYALEQFGYMAKIVFNSWGIKGTSDFGEIVYNLIRIGMMKKSDTDRREDFDDAYDFDVAFQQKFQITMPD